MKHAKPEDAERASAGKKKIIIGILSAVVAIVAVAYGAGVFFFSSHFLPGTEISNMDVSCQEHAVAKQILKETEAKYEFVAFGYDFKCTVPAQDINYKYDTESAYAVILQGQNPWLWFMHLSGDAIYSLDNAHNLATYDKEKFDKIITAAVEEHNVYATDPVSARVGYDAATKKAVVYPETYGTKIDAARLLDSCYTALGQMRTLGLSIKELVQPEFTKDSTTIQAKVKKVNDSGLVMPNIDLKLGDNVAATIDAEMVLDWLVTGENGVATIDDSAISSWVYNFAVTHNTYQSARTYIREGDGKEITVPSTKYSTYGWSIKTDELSAQVIEGVHNGRQEPIQVPCWQEAEVYVEGGRDWGSRYLDVDITEQHVRFFDNGEIIWEADCITGEYGTSKETPLGVNTVFVMKSPEVLIGIENGVEIYRSNVSFWMKFMACGVGFHDATWQTQGFGGTWYKRGYGSHGCVNLSYSNAQSLYSLIKIGDVVVTHY